VNLRFPAFHPAVRLLAFLVLILAVQLGAPVLVLALAAPLLLVAGVGERYRTLLRRSRWLLLSLFLVFALGTPGEALYQHPWSPTREGVLLGLEQGFRLAAVLLAVAWLLQTTRPVSLAQGIHTLAHPLRHLGLSPDRGIARLLLVLRHVDSADAWPHGRDWRRFLDEPAAESESVLEVVLAPLAGRDQWALGGLGLGMVSLFILPGCLT